MESDRPFKYRTLKQAVRFLGTGTHVDVPTSTAHSNTNTYTAHELVDISHLVEMMTDFPRFAILENLDETREVVTYGGAISFAASKLAMSGETQEVEFKPALVLDRCGGIEKAAEDLNNFFKGELVVYLVDCGLPEINYSGPVLNQDAFKETLQSLDRNNPTTAKTVFIMSKGNFFWRRERLNFNDVDASTALASTDMVTMEFGPVICREADSFISSYGRAWREAFSAPRRDSLILVAQEPVIYGVHHVLRCLRLGIRGIPRLPSIPTDFHLADLYGDDFDPEIAITPTVRTTSIGRRRHRPLIRTPPSTTQEEMMAKLYYEKDKRWWTFSSRLLWLTARQLNFNPDLCKDVVKSIVSQLVLRRDMRVSTTAGTEI